MQVFVGQIVRPHGVRGEVMVAPSTDEPGDRFAVGAVLPTEPASAGPLRVEAARPHQGRLIVAFTGFADRDAAQRLRGVRLWVDSTDLPEPEDPDEFHDFQLIGLAGVDPAGQRLGEVVRVEHGPAGDMLVLRTAGGRDTLVPFVRDIVPEVDLAGGRLVLTPPEGLLEL
jgi:16S rRNA processing protein RimM